MSKQNLKIVEEAPAVDPLRVEISIAIADRSSRTEAVAEAKRVVERLRHVLEASQKRRSLAHVKAESEREEYVAHIVDVARQRAPETVPLSAARLALAAAVEESTAAQAAFDLASQKRLDADAALAVATTKVDA